jgi:hypothetical protein
MSQRGQVFELKAGGPDGKKLWAYRYRAGGRGSRRVQQGGFESERAAAEALERALGRLRRERGLVEALLHNCSTRKRRVFRSIETECLAVLHPTGGVAPLRVGRALSGGTGARLRGPCRGGSSPG